MHTYGLETQIGLTVLLVVGILLIPLLSTAHNVSSCGDHSLKIRYDEDEGIICNNPHGLFSKTWSFFCPDCGKFLNAGLQGSEDLWNKEMSELEIKEYLSKIQKSNTDFITDNLVAMDIARKQRKEIKSEKVEHEEQEKKGGVKMPRILRFFFYSAIVVFLWRLLNALPLDQIISKVFGL